jgi:oxaloacetate decarboxylase gamma subunit
MEPTLSELLQSGFQLMIVGMAIVFLFLALLVGAVSLLPNLMRRFEGEPVFEQQTTLAVSTAKHREPAATVDADTRAAIQTAIRRYETDQ